jgi:hypothetical protein
LRYFTAIFLSFLMIGNVQSYRSVDQIRVNLYLEDSNHEELVDYLYKFAGSNRLSVQWFGWYRVDNAINWYERSNEDSSFKIKIELLSEENGSLFFASRPHEDKKIYLVIDYADRKPEWIGVVNNFQRDLSSNGWRLEEIKPPGK